ncbi:MAG TPA: signal peptidase I [Opitutaceae bacterium]|jgi:signal peptidase I|nr:signal peptidase I [Opitutaceae bacterium]
MFGLFESQEKKMRENASNWLEVASRVWNYRRDRLTELESDELVQKTNDLRKLLADKADAARLKLGIESLEGILARTGGAVYPKTSLGENVEFFLVAAIVILGIRTYFVQPFKIPTNSMWPTYYGMTAETFKPGDPAPNPVASALRFLTIGAQRHTITAPKDGEFAVPFFMVGNTPIVAYTVKPGRSWLVLPTKVKEYTFYVDGVPSSMTVPEDFSGFDEAFVKSYFPSNDAMVAQIRKAADAGQVEETSQKKDTSESSYYRTLRVPMGRKVKKGDPIVRFDILTGDQLFVDRMSFNFIKPTVGQGFVFRTDHIPEIVRMYGDQYFIKRLIGAPGDKIEIRDPMIYRNGAPITGSRTFEWNFNKTGLYTGYVNATREDSRYTILFPDETVTVPERSYLALGDNSHNSMDSRYWGFVPEKDVIGRPLFIYYPFTNRFGTAR